MNDHDIPFSDTACPGRHAPAGGPRRVRGARWTGILALALACFGFAAPVAAQETCIPLAEGGTHNNQSGGRPGFHLTTASGASSATGFDRFNYWLDDPRWEGSASHTQGAGSAVEILQFRAMHPERETGYVYLSWWIKNTANLGSASPSNELYVGLAPDGGSSATGVVLKIVHGGARNTAAAAADGTSGQTNTAGIATLWTVDASGALLGSARLQGAQLPAWVADSRVWVDQARPVAGAGPGTYLAVNLRAPLSSNIGSATKSVVLRPTAAATTFRLWYSTRVNAVGSVLELTWPRSTTSTSFGLGTVTTGPDAGADKAPDRSAWQPFRLSSGSTDTATSCTSAGISIEPSDISVSYRRSDGTWTPESTAIGYGPAPGVENRFTATPTNKGASAIPRSALHARFRIANWGAQAGGDADPTTGEWNDVPGLANVTDAGAGNVVTNGRWNLSGSKSYSTAEFQSRSEHQCIQVELFGSASGMACTLGSSSCPGGAQCLGVCSDNGSACSSQSQCSASATCEGRCATGGLDFQRSSAFRNMHTVLNSIVRLPAEINLAGVSGSATSKRAVYLHAEPSNMPAVDFRGPLQTDLLTQPRDTPRGSAATPDQELEATLRQPAYAAKAAVAPTYVIRAFYDSGRKTRSNGTEYAVLQPMVPFGYFLEHPGDLAGWRHELAGADPVPGADGWYVLQVADGGKSTITSTLEGVDPKTFGVSLQLGATLPNGSFGNSYDGSLVLGLDLEYRMDNASSIVATLARDRFSGKAGLGGLHVTRTTVGARRYLLNGATRPFVGAAVGAYAFNPGRNRSGLEVLVGAQHNFSPLLAIEAELGYHHITSNSPLTSYATLTAGLRYRF